MSGRSIGHCPLESCTNFVRGIREVLTKGLQRDGQQVAALSKAVEVFTQSLKALMPNIAGVPARLQITCRDTFAITEMVAYPNTVYDTAKAVSTIFAWDNLHAKSVKAVALKISVLTAKTWNIASFWISQGVIVSKSLYHRLHCIYAITVIGSSYIEIGEEGSKVLNTTLHKSQRGLALIKTISYLFWFAFGCSTFASLTFMPVIPYWVMPTSSSASYAFYGLAYVYNLFLSQSNADEDLSPKAKPRGAVATAVDDGDPAADTAKAVAADEDTDMYAVIAESARQESQVQIESLRRDVSNLRAGLVRLAAHTVTTTPGNTAILTNIQEHVDLANRALGEVEVTPVSTSVTALTTTATTTTMAAGAGAGAAPAVDMGASTVLVSGTGLVDPLADAAGTPVAQTGTRWYSGWMG